MLRIPPPRLVAPGLALALAVPLAAWAQDNGDSPAPADSLRRSTPSGEYVDAASFFRFHGYVTLNAVETVDAAGVPSAGVPIVRRSDSGFEADAALFVGGEPFDGVGSVIEIHFVGRNHQPLLTEAKLTWDVRDGEGHVLRISGGRFWWPFGIHNSEWFSALNSYATVSPAAVHTVPTHYNEIGIEADGATRLSDHVGLNYVVAVGNGVSSFEMGDILSGTAMDTERGRTVTGRVGGLWDSGVSIQVGLSAAFGDMRPEADTSYAAEDSRRYPGSFRSLGPDIQASAGPWSLRGYYYTSRESLDGGPLPDVDRSGYTVETGITVPLAREKVRGVTFHGRVSQAEVDGMSGTTYSFRQYGGGITADLRDHLDLRLVYLHQSERTAGPRTGNGAFVLGLSVGF